MERLGVESSITEMQRVLDLIPRRDAKIQKLLRPFVEKLSKAKKTKITKEKTKPAGQQKKSSQRVKKKEGICNLGANCYINSKAVVGKVIQKSGLRVYQAQLQEKKIFFHLGLADGTGAIKVTVFDVKRYEKIKEGSCYSFRKESIENNIVKINMTSQILKAKAIRVPAALKWKARTIMDPQKPFCSIKEAKTFPDKTEMNVQGTINRMNPLSEVKVKQGTETAKQRIFYLQDDTDSIKICLWGDVAEKCSASAEDFVRVTNVSSNHYNGTVSLNSTWQSKVVKVDMVDVHKGRVEIKGIFKANKTTTHLEAVFNQQMKKLVVGSKLLEKTFNISRDEGFMERLLDAMPLTGQAEIQGDRITAITKL
ncbi:uncharacterized protein LOC115371043 [Myripristis murdjan]|uniref:uncharacterized protein LOC115371043 n=1 Tax=Myripristis murdjan TaxID=586833 RepID=UPI001175CCCF|nr:uncharacterized protein LOC115371043 [Myripristis murdjan]